MCICNNQDMVKKKRQSLTCLCKVVIYNDFLLAACSCPVLIFYWIMDLKKNQRVDSLHIMEINSTPLNKTKV